MSSFSLRTKLLLAFLAICLVFFSGSVVIYYQVNVAREASAESAKRAEDMDKVMELKSLVGVMYGNQADLIINGSADSMKEYRENVKPFNEYVEQVVKSADTDEEKKIAAELKKAAAEFTGSFEKVAAVYNRRATMTPEQLAAEFRRLDGETDLPKGIIYKSLTAMEESLKKESEQAEKATKAALDKVAFASFAIPLAAVIISIIIALFMARLITKPIQAMAASTQLVAKGDLGVKLDVTSKDEIGLLQTNFNLMVNNLRGLVQTAARISEQVAASAEELTASSEQSAQAASQVAESIGDVASGAQQQLVVAGETAAIVQQMSAGIQETAATANQISGQAAKAVEKAGDGAKLIDAAVGQMSNIESKVEVSAQVVARLGERSQEIGQIVDTISGISGQTNLLALNAAIEAARAGEAGRGFAVVADEVRKLAEQSQEAAKQIAQLIGEIQTDTGKAVEAMSEGTGEVKRGADVVGKAGQAFKEIVHLIELLSEQVRDISAATQEMAGGSQQVVHSVQRIDQLSKRTATESQTVSAATEEQSASMEEIASSSQALAKLATDLQAAVAKFRI